MTSIFTPAEAKAFRHQGQTPLASGYTDAELQAVADQITEDFAQICGVSFVPVTVTDEVLAGSGDGVLILPHPQVTAVTAAARRYWQDTTWTDLTTDELATLIVEAAGVVHWPGNVWPHGAGRVKVTYTHGYASAPAQIKRAALILAVNDLLSSNVSDRATQQTNENGTFNLAVPGWGSNQPYGIPIVDATLARYSCRTPGIG